jgi:DNA-binding LacI/PurR family transcriptional regulator
MRHRELRVDGARGGRQHARVTDPPLSARDAPARRLPAPSIRDVAAAAGVSYQTVSRVLNGSLSVSADTRQRVKDSIARLGYRPNRAARALVAGRIQTVTVVTSDTTLYGYASTLQGIEEAARGAGFAVNVIVVDSAGDEHVGLTVDHAADPWAGAVIVIGFDPAAVAVLEGLPDTIPVVAVTQPGGGDHRHASVALDERAAAAAATRYLLGLGHRNVPHVAVPTAGRATARQMGWLDTLQKERLPARVVRSPGWRVADGYEVGLALAADRDVTAVLCGNDDLALGVRRALFDAGRDVPEEVSLIGFDDVPGAAYWTPALTTVRMDFAALGRASFEMALAMLEGQAPGTPDLPAPMLVLRESTGPAPR